MNIIADENIPFASNAFSDFGIVRSLPANDITPNTVKDADALLVRSVTQVNASLLDGSNVRFLGTATIGTDHIDLRYLNAKHITFTDAASRHRHCRLIVTELRTLRPRVRNIRSRLFTTQRTTFSTEQRRLPMSRTMRPAQLMLTAAASWREKKLCARITINT